MLLAQCQCIEYHRKLLEDAKKPQKQQKITSANSGQQE